MNIVIIHQHFRTPDQFGGVRTWFLAQHLLKKGHEVTMITTHNEGIRKEVTIEGIRTIYLPVLYENHFSFRKRSQAFYNFVWWAKREKQVFEQADWAYIVSTPLTTGQIGLFIKKKYSLQFIFEVGDLWPQAPIQLGYIRNPFVKWALYKFEKKIYKHARAIVAMSPDIATYIEKIVSPEKVYTITNMADTEFFQQEGPGARSHKKFTITYAGAIGRANRLIQLLELAKAMKGRMPQLHFNIIGEGAEKLMLEQKQARDGIDNVTIHPPGDRARVREILQASDAVYISYSSEPVLGTGSPNKFFDGLAAGKLIIINFGGWIKSLIEREACGFYTDPRNPEQFEHQIMPYLEDPDLLKNTQSRSFHLAQTSFHHDRLLDQWYEVMKKTMMVQ